MSTGVITSFPETHVFNQLSTHRNSFRQAVGNLRAFFLFRRFAQTAKLPRRPRPFLKYQKGAEEIIACFDSAAKRDAKAFWLEKTPSHLHEIDLIRATVPGALFIVIYRQAAFNIASLISAEALWKRQEYRVSQEGAIARWVEDRARIALIAKHSDVHLLAYEDLLADTESAASAVGKFLGISSKSFKPLNELQNEASKIIQDHEQWKANNTSFAPKIRDEIDPALVAKLETVFAAFDREAEKLQGLKHNSGSER